MSAFRCTLNRIIAHDISRLIQQQLQTESSVKRRHLDKGVCVERIKITQHSGHDQPQLPRKRWKPDSLMVMAAPKWIEFHAFEAARVLKACNSSIIFLIVVSTLGDVEISCVDEHNNKVVVPVKFALPPNGQPIRINVKRLEKVSNNQRGFRFLVEPHLLLRQLQLLGIPKRVC